MLYFAQEILILYLLFLYLNRVSRVRFKFLSSEPIVHWCFPTAAPSLRFRCTDWTSDHHATKIMVIRTPIRNVVKIVSILTYSYDSWNLDCHSCPLFSVLHSFFSCVTATQVLPPLVSPLIGSCTSSLIISPHLSPVAPNLLVITGVLGLLYLFFWVFVVLLYLLYNYIYI